MTQEEIKDFAEIEDLNDEKILQYVLLNRKESLRKREELRRLKKVIPGTTDVIFKNVMKNCPNYLITIISYFLSCDKEILKKTIKIENSELTVNNAMEARKTTDIIVRVFNKILNLEMNTSSYKMLVERNIAYLSKLKGEVFDRGEVYDKIYKVIQINFDLDWKYDDRVIIKFLLTDSDTGTVLTENYQIYNINLPKIREKYYNKEKLSKFERALALLTLDKISDLKEISKGDKDLMEAKEEIERLSDNLGVIGVYDYWFHKERELAAIERDMKERVMEDADKIIKDAKIKAQEIETKAQENAQEIETKAQENAQEIEIKAQKAETKLRGTIKKLLDKGLSIEDIIDITNLSKKEIEKLK